MSIPSFYPDYYRSSYFPATLNNYFILLRIFEPTFSLDFTVRSLPSTNSASSAFGIDLLWYPNSLDRVYVTKYQPDNSSASLCSQIRDYRGDGPLCKLVVCIVMITQFIIPRLFYKGAISSIKRSIRKHKTWLHSALNLEKCTVLNLLCTMISWHQWQRHTINVC